MTDAAQGALDEKLRTQADNRGDDGYDTRLMREAADEIEKQRALLLKLRDSLHPMAGSYWHRRFKEVGL